MATKYNRDNEVYEEIERRRTPWIRQGPAQRPLSLRQRIFIVFMGLVIMIVLGKIAYQLNQESPFVYQSVLRGEALISAKTVQDAKKGFGTITVEIDIGGPKTMVADWQIPMAYWKNLKVGDRVAVHYRLGKRKLSIDLVACGVVALPNQNQ